MLDLSPHLWVLITALGGSGLTLTLALMIAIWLAYGYAWHRALAWLLGLGGAMAIVVLSKLAFLGWGIGVRAWDFTGFSGHAMLSTSVYPIAFFLILARKNVVARLFGVALGLAVGVVVAVSRLALNAHSSSEVISGWLIGMGVALFSVAYLRYVQPRRWSITAISVSFACIMVMLHGTTMPAHSWITQVALQLSGHDRPYLRACWNMDWDNHSVSCPSALHVSTADSAG